MGTDWGSSATGHPERRSASEGQEIQNEKHQLCLQGRPLLSVRWLPGTRRLNGPRDMRLVVRSTCDRGTRSGSKATFMTHGGNNQVVVGSCNDQPCCASRWRVPGRWDPPRCKIGADLHIEDQHRTTPRRGLCVREVQYILAPAARNITEVSTDAPPVRCVTCGYILRT